MLSPKSSFFLIDCIIMTFELYHYYLSMFYHATKQKISWARDIMFIRCCNKLV
jgi:hypothetical protein